MLENLDPKAIQNFVQSISITFIIPEIERRKKEGLVDGNYFPEKIQIIFTIDGFKEIRFDGEVRALIVTNKGEATVNDNFNVEGLSIEKLDRVEDETEFGHVTLVHIRDLWMIAFDFRYGIRASQNNYKIGKEFLDAARYCYENKNYRAMCANLYISAENFAKARFFLRPDSDLRKTKKHEAIAAKVNIHYKSTKIINSEYRETFNYLKDNYDKCRFGERFNIKEEKTSKCIEAIQKFSDEILQLYSQPLVYKE